MKLNWESALLALLVLEILLFGALNPRMLDLNMLLFSTSDFICIGIVALPLTLVIISGGIDISLGSTIGLCAIALARFISVAIISRRGLSLKREKMHRKSIISARKAKAYRDRNSN